MTQTKPIRRLQTRHAAIAEARGSRNRRARKLRLRIEAMQKPGAKYPNSRLRPVIESFIREWEADRPRHFTGDMERYDGTTRGNRPMAAREYLAERAGVDVRAIWRILSGHPTRAARGIEWNDVTEFDTVDRLFCAMRCVWLFHVDREQGGFADLYFANIDAPIVDIDAARAERSPVCPACSGPKDKRAIRCAPCARTARREMAVAA